MTPNAENSLEVDGYADIENYKLLFWNCHGLTVSDIGFLGTLHLTRLTILVFSFVSVTRNLCFVLNLDDSK